jgi:hypothetical protein
MLKVQRELEALPFDNDYLKQRLRKHYAPSHPSLGPPVGVRQSTLSEEAAVAVRAIIPLRGYRASANLRVNKKPITHSVRANMTVKAPFSKLALARRFSSESSFDVPAHLGLDHGRVVAPFFIREWVAVRVGTVGVTASIRTEIELVAGMRVRELDGGDAVGL